MSPHGRQQAVCNVVVQKATCVPEAMMPSVGAARFSLARRSRVSCHRGTTRTRTSARRCQLETPPTDVDTAHGQQARLPAASASVQQHRTAVCRRCTTIRLGPAAAGSAPETWGVNSAGSCPEIHRAPARPGATPSCSFGASAAATSARSSSATTAPAWVIFPERHEADHAWDHHLGGTTRPTILTRICHGMPWQCCGTLSDARS